MEKERQYQFEKIEICRNCGGMGRVEPEREWRLKRILGLPKGVASGECEVCGGTGRVKKRTEITITVRPFSS